MALEAETCASAARSFALAASTASPSASTCDWAWLQFRLDRPVVECCKHCRRAAALGPVDPLTGFYADLPDLGHEVAAYPRFASRADGPDLFDDQGECFPGHLGRWQAGIGGTRGRFGPGRFGPDLAHKGPGKPEHHENKDRKRRTPIADLGAEGPFLFFPGITLSHFFTPEGRNSLLFALVY